MDFVAKKGDILFIEINNETLAVIVLQLIPYNNKNYLKVISTPINPDKILTEKSAEIEYVQEVVDGENFLLEPVLDQTTIDTLKLQQL